MNEDKQYLIGTKAEELLADSAFNELVALCESQLSLQMLDSDTSERREEVHRTYLGLKSILDMMQQFVILKDQIAEKIELEAQKRD